ncbi:MAG TPA: WecB/TagA/CpsF family glycosyltransferase [Chthoniobacterales bacterium]|nr:WecB/TagA/CpsF family glycosyltransferase [Chthoniobacterales bacterium]
MPDQQILGIKFFDGDVDQAIDKMARDGGFLIAPSGTCFARLRRDGNYRLAVTNADLAIPDSGAMVLLWRIFRGKKIGRISGLRYTQRLTARLFAENARPFWVLPNDRAAQKTREWLRANRFRFDDEDFYIAPIYGRMVEDRQLLARVESRNPRHVVVAIGSGPQEKLGLFLRESLFARSASIRPAIHCIGAALGFLTGEQVAIPGWADRLYLGWLLRLFAQPRIFVPRLARAIELPWLILRYGETLPPLARNLKH